MKKIIDKSKLIFYVVLLFIFGINNTVATTITIEHGPHFINFNEVMVRNFLPWILSVIGMLIFFVFIISIIIYLFYKKNIDKNKQKIIKTKKNILLFLKGLILIFVLYLSIIIFEYDLINILDKFN